MNLIIDIGNSFSKLAFIQHDEIIALETIEGVVSLNQLELLIQKHNPKQTIVSSVVVSIDEIKNYLINNIESVIELNSTIQLPIKINYKTPQTLGNDRIALAAFGANEFPNQNVLVIDSGTCITYEFISDDGTYHGGAISPGLEMRFKALHNFTSKLPLLQFNDFDELIGQSTQESIWSGVQNGFIKEIDGFIDDYKSRFKNNIVIITGGGYKFLQSRLKNNTFAHPNALIKGLNNILNYNANQ